MIGRLLQTAANSLAGPRDGGGRGSIPQNVFAKQLESNIEEAHTRDLIYPDIEALKTSQHSALSSINGRVPATPAEANSFDDRGGLDITSHDVRIVIAQHSNANSSAAILYDSKPRRTSTPQQEHGPAASQRLHNRGKSFTSPPLGKSGHGHTPSMSGADSTTPTSPLAPHKSRGFFNNIPANPDLDSPDADSPKSRAAKEHKERAEEAKSILACIFGAPGHRVEPGTKLHVLPKRTSELDRSQTISAANETQPRRGNLARSSSAFDGVPARGSSAPPTAHSGRTSVMITRLFNVQLAETTVTDDDYENPITPDAQNRDLATETGGLSDKPTRQSHRLKQKKTPPYAIALIIELPTEAYTRTRSNPYHGVISLPSSYQSSAPTSPRFPINPSHLSWMDLRPQGSLSADSLLSSQISYIMGNWSLLSRNLRLLEATTKLRLLQLLENAIPLVPLPVASHGKAGNPKLRLPKPPSQQAVSVDRDCFQDDVQIRKRSRDCIQQVASGLRTRRVTPGQSRWGAWREEARSINRWAGSKDQNFFFFVFMTAFLGQHSAWLEQLAPKWWRRRAARQKQSGQDDLEALPRRTVLACENKMDARRFIFLAASFLPTNFKNSFPALAPPLLAYSESPPSLPTPREGPVQSGLRKSFSAAAGQSGHGRSVSFTIARASDDATDDERSAFGEELGRRASEAGSIRSTFGPLNTPRESRKTTASTLLSDAQRSAQPVPHFANASVDSARDNQTTERPGSSASMVSVHLNQALKRSESSGAGSVGHRLGHMMSGLWSTAADSEAISTETTIASPENTPHNRRLHLNRGQSTSAIKPTLRSPNKLDRMVEEASMIPKPRPDEINGSTPTPLPFGRSPGNRAPLDLESCLKKTPTGTSAEDKSAARSIPRRAEPDRMPLQLNMNETDGFVDVSMPPGQSLNTSLASSFASLRMSSFGQPSAYSSIHGLWTGSGAGALTVGPSDTSEHFSPYGSPTFVGSRSPRPEKTPEVAGWLKKFHPDFLLQAVQPYDDLRSDVRAALQTEARLSYPVEDDSDLEESDEWRDIASVLVAEVSKFRVDRVTLQRRKRQLQPHKRAAANKTEAHPATTGPDDAASSSPSSPFFVSRVSSAVSLAELQVEERIITEPLMDVDPDLIDAFERVLAQNPNAGLREHSRTQSNVPSGVPSRKDSPIRSRPVSVMSSHPGQHPQSTSGTKQKQALDARQAHSSSSVGAEQKHDSGKFTGAQSAEQRGASALKQVPFADCRGIILEALKKIARNVIDERDLSDKQSVAQEKEKDSKRGGGGVVNGHVVDSTLREGVSRWLSQVQESGH